MVLRRKKVFVVDGIAYDSITDATKSGGLIVAHDALIIDGKAWVLAHDEPLEFHESEKA